MFADSAGCRRRHSSALYSPRLGLSQPPTRVRRPDEFRRSCWHLRDCPGCALTHMTGPCGPRISHFSVRCFGVSHSTKNSGGFRAPREPMVRSWLPHSLHHQAPSRGSTGWRSRPMRDLLVGQDRGRLIGRQLAVLDLVSHDSPGPDLQGPPPSRSCADILLRPAPRLSWRCRPHARSSPSDPCKSRLSRPV